MKELFEPDCVNYILRTYLPTWNYQERTKEIIRFCKETGTRHVMLFTDAQHMAWNQLTLEEARHEAENIARAGQRLAAEGIRIGVNSSYNMPKSPWDHRKHNDYDFWATCADGSCEYRTPCLLDPKLDDYLRQFFTIVAEINPDYIYIDDDHRYVLDGKKDTWGCFCDLHLLKFGKITGTVWTRETLTAALQSDAGIRRQWIDLLGARLLDIAEIIRTAVHRVNPEIEVGMMIPSIHPLPAMGHTIKNVARVFSPNGKPLMRPCIGPYSDHYRRQIIPGLFYLQFTGHLFGDDAIYTPEIETAPFSRFSKSMTVVRFHIVQGLLNRMNNPAISLCGYTGDSPFFETAYVDFLKGTRSYFEGVRAIAPPRGVGKGIQFIFDFASATTAPHDIESVFDLYWPSFVLHDILGNTGFPCTYDESPVRFLAGDTAYALPEQRIRELLGSGLVLDAIAARALAERGFAELIGVSVGDEIAGYGAEECLAEEYFGRYVGSYIPMRGTTENRVFALHPTDGAVEISRMVDNNRREIASGVVLFENKTGGKVAVLPYKIGALDVDLRHFVCYQRQQMFRRIFEWMNPSVLPVFVETPSDFSVQCWDDGQRLIACLTNLSYDVTESFVVHFAASDLAVEQASYLDDEGRLVKLGRKLARKNRGYEIHHRLTAFQPFILVVDHGS